jgi:hypothetical protein
LRQSIFLDIALYDASLPGESAKRGFTLDHPAIHHFNLDASC